MHVCVVYFVSEVVAENGIKVFSDVRFYKECSMWVISCIDAIKNLYIKSERWVFDEYSIVACHKLSYTRLSFTTNSR